MSAAKVARRSHLAYTRRCPIEYTLSGRGGACLVLHGGHGNCFMPFGTEEAFRVGLRVLMPSRPGYGRTPAEVGQTVLWRLSPETVLRRMISSFSTLPVSEVLATMSAAERAAFGEMLDGMASGSGFMLDLEHDVGAQTLETICTPTLIVHSKSDSAVPFAHAEHTRAHIAGAALLEAPGWGYLLWLGGNEVIDNMVAFLRA